MPNNVEPNFFHPWLPSVTLANDSLPLALHQGVEEESFGGWTVWQSKRPEEGQQHAGALWFAAVGSQVYFELFLRLCHEKRVCNSFSTIISTPLCNNSVPLALNTPSLPLYNSLVPVAFSTPLCINSLPLTLYTLIATIMK